MVASVLYQKGVAEVGRILAALRKWMDENEYNSVQQLKGSMSYENYPDPAAFQRGNYMKTLTSYVARRSDPSIFRPCVQPESRFALV